MTGQMWVGVLYVIFGLLIVVLCFLLLAGRIRRTRWYGFGLPRTYESEETLPRINVYGARHMIRSASALMGFGVFLIIAPDAGASAVRWIIIGAPLLLLIPIVQSLWYARRISRE